MDRFDKLRTQRKYPRAFLEGQAELGTWDTIKPYMALLLERNTDSKSDLEQWLADWSELAAAVSEEGSIRYIRMTCDTENPDIEESYLEFLETVVPEMEAARAQLNTKFLASPACGQLDARTYDLFRKHLQNDVEIFRPENIELQTQDDVLSQKYQKLVGGLTAEFDGREQTMPQLQAYSEYTNRSLRRDAFSTMAKLCVDRRDEFESIYDEMITLRTRMARNAGFDNYLQYQFRRLGRFDYTAENCEEFHRAVEDFIVPQRNALRAVRRQKLGLDALAPYDLAVDPEGREPLRPFSNAHELIAGTDAIFRAVDPVFSEQFAQLREHDLLDLESRKGKGPGGYQDTLSESRLPFIFMNATGRNTDVFTLLHEGGHAFHAIEAKELPIHQIRHAPIEFCEVASMGMEMMACEKLEHFYSPADAARARAMHLEEVITILPWIARVDAFQHWVYKNPSHSRAERQQAWLDLDARFGDELDWSETPEYRQISWVSKLHFFCVPLYYIEYGIAQLGALQLWMNYQQDPKNAVAQYRAGLALGGMRPLPELFATAGLNFRFDETTVAPLAKRVGEALAEIA